MKKSNAIILAASLAMLLVFAGSASASKIVWVMESGSGSQPESSCGNQDIYCVFNSFGEVGTNETSRTKEAARQAYDAIFSCYANATKWWLGGSPRSFIQRPWTKWPTFIGLACVSEL